MLTIYEQIQRAIDLVESDLSGDVSAAEAARHAYMSVRGLHRYFPALTGYRFGEYVRRRRLADAAQALRGGDASILAIALDRGYESHEAFGRAFKDEFGLVPSEFRAGSTPAAGARALDLVGEVSMGVLTKTLPRTQVVVFDGFRPDPEQTALEKAEVWLERHAEHLGPHRRFGHNIDSEEQLAFDPVNIGYRVMVTLPESADWLKQDAKTAIIEAGTFVVTGIEGSFQEDPAGAWIREGWLRLDEMIRRNGLEVHPAHRWYEEMLEPLEPGRTRFDLYVELAEARELAL